MGGNVWDQRLTPDNKRVETVPFSGCWIWLGKVALNGYGQMMRRGRYVYAHRWSWEQANGAPPSDLLVLHKCDIRCCVNPDHLFLGTHADNCADKMAKGRHPAEKISAAHIASGWNVGEKCPTAKLSNEQAIEIFRTPGPRADIAARYGVTVSVVSAIRTGRAWSRVTGAQRKVV